jgi:hypothetical protein
MSQDSLDDEDVYTGFEQTGRECSPEIVRA